MHAFHKLEYSKSHVRRVGKQLGKDLVLTDQNRDELSSFFRIGHNWVVAHILPMNRILTEIRFKMRKLHLEGTVVGRSKSMGSIRKKLKNQAWQLSQIQDLAGCRVVLPSIQDVNNLIYYMRANAKHTIHDEDDYISAPKDDGYRSHHMIFKYDGKDAEIIYNGMRIELQIRTRLQHSWATAVETVGLYLNEDLKGGVGNTDWLRLFKLMSKEFSITEGYNIQESSFELKERHTEIQALNKKLDAIAVLENLTHAINYTDNYKKDPKYKASYFLIEYDNSKKIVRVKPYDKPLEGAQSFGNLPPNTNDNSFSTRVLVEADKIETLKKSFPNYFGDVQLFRESLKTLINGEKVEEYILPPQITVTPLPRPKKDLSWLKTTGRIRMRHRFEPKHSSDDD